MRILTFAACAAMAVAASGQTALDAYQLSQGDLKGTARFVSMGGAFTALGGDLSTMQQNPAGVGIYRSSDVGISLNVDMHSVKANGLTTDQTKVSVPNFGYIGAFRTGSETAPYFSFGVSYGRVASFDRKYSGSVGGVNSSLSNYVAGYTAAEGWTTNEIFGYNADYDPFYSSRAPWMSILLYNAYAINPSNDQQTDYEGLYNGTPGSMTFDVIEKGYVDEYNIDLGGNILNTVYWGIGFGITDIDYSNNTYYTESFEKATISTPDANGRTQGEGQFGLLSRKRMSGTGFNFKAGVIVKPVNELRIGFAVHTPTYYNIDYTADAQTNFRYVYSGTNSENLQGYFPTNSTYGAEDYFRWKLRTPWRLMAGVAGVIGNKAIVSLDYEYRACKDIKVRDDDGNEYGDVVSDVKTYYRGQSIIRVGAEYRVTPHFSIRAGYVWEQAPTSDAFRNGDYAVYTSGPDDTETQPSFIMDKGTRYITVGLGYNFRNFYVAAAYVNKHRESIWQGYTDYEGGANATRYYAPRAKLTDSNSQLVFSVGYRF